MTRILFIEDERAFAIGVIDRLRADGYDVRWESNGSAGYQAACANTFDLILLDVSTFLAKSRTMRAPRSQT